MSSTLVTTRRGLHALAELVLAGPQYRAHGAIRLQVTRDGLTTVAGPRVHMDGTAVRTERVANLTLESIDYDPNGHSTAVLRGVRVHTGDRLASYTVVAIHENSVTLQAANGHRRVLRVGETEDPL